MCVRFIDLKKIKYCLLKRRECGKKIYKKMGWFVFKKKRFFFKDDVK